LAATSAHEIKKAACPFDAGRFLVLEHAPHSTDAANSIESFIHYEISFYSL
jgi:hypothetical protein